MGKARRGRPKLAQAKRRATTRAGRLPPVDLGTDQIRRLRQILNPGQPGLPADPLSALYSRSQTVCQIPDKLVLGGAGSVFLPAFAAAAVLFAAAADAAQWRRIDNPPPIATGADGLPHAASCSAYPGTDPTFRFWVRKGDPAKLNRTKIHRTTLKGQADAAQGRFVSVTRLAVAEWPYRVRFRQVFAAYSACVALNFVLPSNLGTIVMFIMLTTVIASATFAGRLSATAQRFPTPSRKPITEIWTCCQRTSPTASSIAFSITWASRFAW